MAQDSVIKVDTITPGAIGRALNSTNLLDSAGNQINSFSKFSGSTNAAVNHNFQGITPNFVSTCVTGTATATSYGTFTGSQVTTAMTAAAAYVALAGAV